MSFMERVRGLEQHFNPLLVKEVRQSLRSKRFRASFGFTVLAGLLVSVSIILSNTSGIQRQAIGGPFFVGAFGCLAGAVLMFVPLNAFNAMSAEFDEDTYDMLVVSRLRPRQIIIGKLLASGVMALLFFSAFGFNIVFAFLLGGIDPTVVFLSMPALAILSLTFSSLSLCLSSLSQKRVVRVGLTIALSALALWALIGSIVLVIAFLEEGIDLGDPDMQLGITLALIGAAAVTTLSLAIGASRLAHVEENRSTSLRVASFVMAMAVLGWGVWGTHQLGLPEEFLHIAACLACVAAAAPGAFFASERETLGMRVRNTLPSSQPLRILALPWLPGGARGFLWMMMTFALIVLIEIGAAATGPTSRTDMPNVKTTLTVITYLTIYTNLFPALLPCHRERPRRMLINRSLVLTIIGLGMIGPTIAGYLLDQRRMANGRHLGNPIQTIGSMGEADPIPTALLVGFGLVVLLQLRRVLQAFVEVTRAPRAS